MPRDFSSEQEGLVAVTVMSFTKETVGRTAALKLELSDGGWLYLFAGRSRLRLMRQIDRSSSEAYPTDEESIVDHLITFRTPIIVRRKVKFTVGEDEKALWYHKLPADVDLLCGQ